MTSPLVEALQMQACFGGVTVNGLLSDWTDPNGGGQWGNDTEEKRYDKAQQYIIGYQNILPGWTWAVFGNGT